MTFDKELLFKPRLPEADVDVPGIGTVRVRGLTRTEAMSTTRGIKSEADATERRALIERRMLAIGLVDPVLTEDEVRRWQDASPAGELEPVTDKINQLSGNTPTAEKEAYVEFEESPDVEFRLPPS